MTVERFYRLTGKATEHCFYVETSSPLTRNELEVMRWLLAETFEPNKLRRRSFLTSQGQTVIELGPRLNVETPLSSSAVAICHNCGLSKVTRLECSRRYLLPPGVDPTQFIASHHDRMTECQYPKPLETFDTGIIPEGVYYIPLIQQGPEVLRQINKELGLGMDDWDIDLYSDLFINLMKRNPSNVECFLLGQVNSEHARHGFFKGRLIIDSQEMPEALLQIIKSPLIANLSNSVIAFGDNASAIRGYTIRTIIPQFPGKCSPFMEQELTCHHTFTAETHNHPTGVAPFHGAATGPGGRIRDGQGVGQGGLVMAGTAGYGVGALGFPDYLIPGELPNLSYPHNLASPLEILIEGSNGVSDYGNKFGEPLIQGFVRTFDLPLLDGKRKAWIKPVLFTGGVGQIDSQHIKKEEPKKGMLVVQVGGPAYSVGFGGASGSSMMAGESQEELDFQSVQRGDPEMEQKLNRVVRACVEMGNKSPILSIHDQGGGGLGNVLTEIVTPAGGRIELREVTLGDKTMSVIAISFAEYQERDAFLIQPERIEEFKAICYREKVNCEVLGEITGEGRIVFHDSQDGSTPVNLDLGQILGNVPQKIFHLERQPKKLEPLDIPSDLSVKEALEMIFRLPSVGSKGYLVRKVDRSVTGLVAQQQCAGPLQLPVADVAVVAQSHFGLTGAAISIGEQPIKMLVDDKAGARMAAAEALTNLVWARISNFNHIKCSANWMWAAKLPGEGARLYDAAVALRDLMIELGIAVDGGKDSLSMAAKVGQEMVKAPGELVISAYAPMSDITKVVTPDIKQPGKSRLIFLDLAPGKNRLGGSALAQALGQIGEESPDVEDPLLLVNAFAAIQEMIDKNLILAGHDRSDGGLITTLAEMAMAGNCGMLVQLSEAEGVMPYWFSEELGLVIEYLPENEPEIVATLNKFTIPSTILGNTIESRQVIIQCGSGLKNVVLNSDTVTLLGWWESTSDRLEQEQMNPTLAKRTALFTHGHSAHKYRLTFKPQETPAELLSRKEKPRVAIIREEGSNGDREMTSAFFAAGFEPWDVNMTDLLRGKISLDQFRGVVFVGGFSYADVLDSAKGWAGAIKFNKNLREMFDNFYQRTDTFSLGVCNGCQLMAFLGWVPWPGIPETKQPRFIRNPSGRFESRWVAVRISDSPSIMFKGMEGSVLGIWVAHGEGRLYFPDHQILHQILFDASAAKLTPLRYVDYQGRPTEEYPFNPNDSPEGITALCDPTGRHLALMPHPERTFLLWQWSWLPEDWKTELQASPWLRVFQNAREWCEN